MQAGAQVMLLKNLELDCGERMLVNGSRGVITKFVSKQVSSGDFLINLTVRLDWLQSDIRHKFQWMLGIACGVQSSSIQTYMVLAGAAGRADEGQSAAVAAVVSGRSRCQNWRGGRQG